MRKPIILGISFACLLTAPALGALATFEGLNPGSVGNKVWVSAGTDALFDVTVSVESLAGFNFADVVIGSDAVPDLSFEYSSAWNAAISNVQAITYDNGYYAHDVWVGGSNPAGSVGQSLLVGRVTVSTVGLPDGDYTVSVDPARDQDLSALWLNAATEPLSGVGIIHIPEPASIGLLIIAAFVGFVRRR